MYKFKLLLLVAFTFAAIGVAQAQQMSDEQVVQYVREASQSGKSQKVITTELMRRGVTREQVQRIQQKYQGQQAAQRNALNEGAPSRLVRQQIANEEMPDRVATEADSLREVTAPAPASSRIFGHNLFRNSRLTFEPANNMSAPASYRLGPGDEVVIQIWGASENTIRSFITPEGNIQVSGLGPVQLSGMTVKEANAYLQQEFAKIYSGIGGEQPTSQIKLTVGDIRTIQVNIMGEVTTPGTYTISSFSTLFHALYRAGGVNDIGTLRAIRVVRGGKTLATVDVYDYILRGITDSDIRLQDDDVIIVGPYQQLVEVTGMVKRPMIYELKKDETAKTLLEYAGGFSSSAYKESVTITRKGDSERRVLSVDEAQYASFPMQDGDVVDVGGILNRYENRLEVRGAVYRPGIYQLDPRISTVLELVKAAEGVTGDAYLYRALLDRENDDLTHTTISMNLGDMLAGKAGDIPLKRNDVLYVASIHDLTEQKTVSIHGRVAHEGTYLYADRMTVPDLLVMAGGLLEDASYTNVEVARRIKDPHSGSYSEELGQTFIIDLSDGPLNSDDLIQLQPFDEVFVRKSPAYHRQESVSIDGEVLFAGNYALNTTDERLSTLVAKAGGVTPAAYVKGARLVRQMTPDEIRRQQDLVRMAEMSQGRDTLSVANLQINTTSYTVGIDLAQALARPGSDADLVLREGDIIFVPKMINTVKINGAVLYPNTVLYKAGEKLDYYINLAGGYTDNAKKSRAYVVYLNGTVSRIKGSNRGKIEPGCEIVIPTKPNRRGMGVGEILSIGTTSASLATMIATLVNLFTK
jgi:protein involved in polysaccharide export with SLBB domain